MFYYLRGFISPVGTTAVVVDVSGVGYLVSVSSFTMGEVMKNSDAEMMLYIHTAIREDAIELFGFADVGELDLFRLLISVSGIGPKAAMSLLSTMTPGELASAIALDNKKAISCAPGIGLKTAARIVLELKDKITSAMPQSDSGIQSVKGDESVAEKLNDVADSLSSLGYTRSEISSVMAKLDRAGDTEQMIKQALKYLMR